MLDLLAGRYPSDEFAELRPRIVWERTTGALRAREGAQRIAIANAGTIPDRGLYGVFLVDGGGRVGELDEEMVHEAREGQVFLLGASAWRIEQIARDRVIVSPAPGQPAQVPFWKGEQAGRPLELGRAVGRLQRELAALDDESAVQRLTGLHACDERAARTLVEYLREQELATGVLPSDRTIVVERFRDEIGDWRLCMLSPFGARVHAPWGLALRALLREQHGIETHALWSDDGIILHLPDADALPPDELVAIDPERIEDLVVGELGGSSLFGARFRESAARALLIPRRRPGQRTPLWQQRLRAQSLLAVAERYGSFPILLETYRELLADHFDLGALRELLAGLRDGSRQLVAVESQTASPFAASLNFEYVAQYLYEDDAPAAERRVAALTLDRDLLRELAGLGRAARPARRRRARAGRARARRRAPRRRRRAARPAAPRRRPRRGRARRRACRATRREAVAELLADRRALRLRIGGEDRLIAAEDAGRYRDALGTMPPRRHAGGLPRAGAGRAAVARGALRALARAVPDAGCSPSATTSSPPSPSASSSALERAGALVHGALRPGGSGSEWCDVEVLRRIRRASVARLRREVEAVEQPALARFALAWHGAGRKGRGGIDRLREVLFPLQRLPLAPEVWERQVLPLRMDYRPELLDQLCTSGELVWLGADAGRVAIAFREDAALLGPPPGQAPPPADPAAEAVRAALQGARHLGELGSDTGLPETEVIEALWRLVASGEVTNDAWEPLRRARRAATPRTLVPRARHAPAHAQAARRRAARRSGAGRPRRRCSHAAIDESDRRRALAELLLERHGVLVRAAVVAEGVPGGPAGLRRALGELETLGVSRRGYLVDGLGGAQHALPGAIERLREVRDPASGRARDRAGRERSGESLRRRAALAGAGRRPCLARGRRARSSCATASRWRSSSAEPARCSRCSRSSSPTGPPSPRRSRRRRSKDAPDRCSSSASTASPRPVRPSARRVHRAGFVAGPRRLDAAREALDPARGPHARSSRRCAWRRSSVIALPRRGPGRQSPFGLAAALDGRVLESVEARGKHLLLRVRRRPHPPLAPAHDRRVARLSRGPALARAARNAWLSSRANGLVAVQFGGPVLELLDRARARAPPRAARARPRPARRRPADRGRRRSARGRARTPRGRSARCCSTRASRRASATSCAARRCTRCAIDPWAPLGGISDETLTALLEQSRRDPPGRRARRRSDCRKPSTARAAAAAAAARSRGRGQGDEARIVHWCPACQTRLQIIQRASILLHRESTLTISAAAADTGTGESAD